MGLPFFSLAMIAADAVFLPTPFLHRLGGWAARVRARLSRVAGPAGEARGGGHPRSPEDSEPARVGFPA
jgi:hypothetical protein